MVLWSVYVYVRENCHLKRRDCGGNIFYILVLLWNMSRAESMGVNGINGIWTLHSDHMAGVSTFAADQEYLNQD